MGYQKSLGLGPHYGAKPGYGVPAGASGPAPLVYVPLNGTEPGIVFGINYNNTAVDVTGNHTMKANTVYTAAKSYDGLRAMAALPGGSGSVLHTATGTAHQIPTATGVTFGGMYIINASQTQSAPCLVASANGSGGTNAVTNYGVSISGTQLRYVPGAGDFGNTIPRDTHVHIVVSSEPGRDTAKLYLNGAYYGPTDPGSNGTANASDYLTIGERATVTNKRVDGWVSDFFVASGQLTDAQILQYATNAFGTTPPAAV